MNLYQERNVRMNKAASSFIPASLGNQHGWQCCPKRNVGVWLGVSTILAYLHTVIVNQRERKREPKQVVTDLVNYDIVSCGQLSKQILDPKV